MTVARAQQPYRGGEPVEIEAAPGGFIYGERLQPTRCPLWRERADRIVQGRGL